MNSPPTGTVTFLFTDIEGSTKLSQEFPNALPLALDKHHSIMRSAIESNTGFIFEIIGDAFCAAFENADGAVSAAVDAQLYLKKEKWCEAVIKVRMGLHTGIVEWNGKRYMGYITLARTARVMSAAYGEQVIISNDVYELAREKASEKISFRDLGERRLKDLKQPVRLYQVLSDGLREDFPPLKTLDARPNNLPVQLTSFIGRDVEKKFLKELIKQTHLLTLTGTGGAGKTRLALQFGADLIDDFANGVWLIELAAISQPGSISEGITKSLGITEVPNKSLENTIIDFLKDKEILLILDNCEHLINASAVITEKLLINCPKLKIIATSREALKCSGEQIYNVPSLEIPDSIETSPDKLSQYEAVRLFIERALLVNSNFRVNNDNAPSLAQICFRLDGIPLGIELAATWIKVLPLEEINERLNDRFNFLTGGKRTALHRQYTLKATIDWSYDLLTEDEKILWNRLSVFAGGWSLEAAESVCSDEKIKSHEILMLLISLAEKSIISYEQEHRRYRMLETIKQYGKEKLEQSGEAGKILSNDLSFFVRLAEHTQQFYYGPEEKNILKTLDIENDNLESVLNFAMDNKEYEKGLRLAGALGYFWERRSHFIKGERWLSFFINQNINAENNILAPALFQLGKLSIHLGKIDASIKSQERCLAIFRETGNKSGAAKCLYQLGYMETLQGKYGIAVEHLQEAMILYQELEKKSGIVSCYMVLGDLEGDKGDLKNAKRHYEKALLISRESGNKSGAAASLWRLGYIGVEQGLYQKAREFFEESLEIFRVLSDISNIAYCLRCIGEVEIYEGNFTKAKNHLIQSEELYRKREEYKLGIGDCLFLYGLIYFLQKDYEKAMDLFKKALNIFREYTDKLFINETLRCIGKIDIALGQIQNARKTFHQCLTESIESGYKNNVLRNILSFAHLNSLEGNLQIAAILFGNVRSIIEELGFALRIYDKDSFEELNSVLKKNFTGEELSEYHSQGKAMTLEQAGEFALKS